MPIEHTKGGTLITGTQGLAFYRLIALKSALKLEKAGMKVNRHVNARKLAKAELGVKTNDYDKLIGGIEALIAAQRLLVTHIYDQVDDSDGYDDPPSGGPV